MTPQEFGRDFLAFGSIKSCWRAGHGMEWKMEWNGNFGMEYGRCQNGMEWKILRMEWKTIFHTSIPIPF